MGVIKFREKRVFQGPVSFVGSVGFSGVLDTSTTARFGGPVTINGTQTFSASPVLNVPLASKTGSAAYQPAGVLRINSGATSATASTTAINSGGFVFITPVILGGGVASYNLIGQVVVTTVAQAASGGYFSLGFTGTQNGLGASVDVFWHIINPA